jgi:hypothetical protein
MEHGVIQDFYTAAKGTEKSVVKFLVKNEEEQSDNACTVCAEIPNAALEHDMVKPGSTIGWEDPKVYIEIEGVEDVPFKKVGPSGGDEVTFYEHLKAIGDVEEKGDGDL